MEVVELVLPEDVVNFSEVSIIYFSHSMALIKRITFFMLINIGLMVSIGVLVWVLQSVF